MATESKDSSVSDLIVIIFYLLIHALWGRLVFGIHSFAILEFLFLLSAYIYFKKKNQVLTLSNLFSIRKFEQGSAISFIALVLLCVICRILAHYFLFSKEVYEPIVTIAHSDVTVNLGDFIYQCLIPPVFEELLFRGLFLSILLKELKHNPVLAVFLSAMIFAGIHPTYKEVYLAAFVPGLIYGYAFIRTRSVLSSIILHALWNVFTFIPFP